MKYEYGHGANSFSGSGYTETVSHVDGIIRVDVGPVRITMTRQEAKRLKDRIEKAIAETRPATAPEEPDVTTKAYQEFAPPAPEPFPLGVSGDDMVKFLTMYRHAKQVGWI